MSFCYQEMGDVDSETEAKLGHVPAKEMAACVAPNNPGVGLNILPQVLHVRACMAKRPKTQGHSSPLWDFSFDEESRW
jgi:hypothetical protein